MTKLDLICDILAQEYDVDDIIDLLDPTPEELVDYLYDLIDSKQAFLAEHLGVDEDDSVFSV